MDLEEEVVNDHSKNGCCRVLGMLQVEGDRKGGGGSRTTPDSREKATVLGDKEVRAVAEGPTE